MSHSDKSHHIYVMDSFPSMSLEEEESKESLSFVRGNYVNKLYQNAEQESFLVEIMNDANTIPTYINHLTKDDSVSSLLTRSDKNNGMTPLHIAAKNNKLQVIKLLLNRTKAITYNNYDCIISKYINVKDNCGRTALMYAVEVGSLDIVKELLYMCAYVDIRDNNQCTALILATHINNIDIIKSLFNDSRIKLFDKDYDNYLYMQDKSGLNAMDYAIEYAYIDIIKYLHKKGCCIDKNKLYDKLIKYEHNNITQLRTIDYSAIILAERSNNFVRNIVNRYLVTTLNFKPESKLPNGIEYGDIEVEINKSGLIPEKECRKMIQISNEQYYKKIMMIILKQNTTLSNIAKKFGIFRKKP